MSGIKTFLAENIEYIVHIVHSDPNGDAEYKSRRLPVSYSSTRNSYRTLRNLSTRCYGFGEG